MQSKLLVNSDLRRKAVDSLEKFLNNEITNDDFADYASEILHINSQLKDMEDRGICELHKILWLFYEDIYETYRREKLPLNEYDRSILHRINIFLITDLEYKWPDLRRVNLIESSSSLANFDEVGSLFNKSEGPIFIRIMHIFLWPFLFVLSHVNLTLCKKQKSEAGQNNGLYGMQFRNDGRYKIGDITVWPFHTEDEFQYAIKLKLQK